MLLRLLSALSLFVLSYCGQFTPESIPISVVVRDFWPAFENGTCREASRCGQNLPSSQRLTCVAQNCHRDFQAFTGNEASKGYIQNFLSSDEKPILREENVQHWHTSQEFDQWYRTDRSPGNGVVNKAFIVNLTFTNSEANDNIYSYESSSFFPINRRGFGDYESSKNYHFTTELTARFQYKGGEVFTFSGDDDLWVFINGRLAVDIGGLHPSVTDTIRLDEKAQELGLVIGGNYPFHIFHAERRTVDSNFRAYTSIDLYCPDVDHCGVCNGQGDSCCTCNDNDPCTDDRCDRVSGACSYTPRVCQDDGNACTIEFCDSTVPGTFSTATHCKSRDRVCQTEEPCNLSGFCNPASGCFFPPRNCNDNNLCTADSCGVDGCVNTTIPCVAPSVCQVAECSPSTGCRISERDCDDKDKCTIDSCDPDSEDQTDPCVHEPIFTGTCDPNIDNPCILTDENGQGYDKCTPFDKCTPVLCDSQTGDCSNGTRRNCDDRNACTINSCNGDNGECEFELEVCPETDPCFPAVCDPEIGCSNVNFADSCNDNNPCTADSCVVVDGSPTCLNEDIVCDDDNLCTIDECSAVGGGCSFTPRSCDDNNACTEDTCNPETGCSNDPIALPVGDACITSFCDPRTGVVSSPVVCRPTDRCRCDPIEGCKCDPRNFFQENPETTALGALAITLITVGAVGGAAIIAIGGKKGYDYYSKSSNSNFAVQDNPAYVGSETSVENQLYEPAAEQV